jgi:cytochrome c oxidase subunit 2
MPLMVTAQQFEWTFQYPEKMVGSGDTATPVTTHQLHVPVDRQLAVSLTALDVLHSFWVPEWRIKRDLVPARDPSEEGVDNTFVVTPDVEGTFSLVCTELCGTGHATMRAPVVVESQEEFDRWLDEQARAQASTAGAGAAAAGDGT